MRLSVCFLLCILAPIFSHAAVHHIEIQSRSLVLEGKSFGEAGPYELLSGRIYFAFDPANPANQKITDIALADRDSLNLVWAWSQLMVLQPVDSSKRSGLGLVEVSNRGSKFMPRYFLRAGNSALDPTDSVSFGDGLLMEAGMTLMWIGWQWDVPEPGLRLHVPIARNPDGSSIHGWVRSDWTVDESVFHLRLGHRNLTGYSLSDPQEPEIQFTMRAGRLAPRFIVPDSLWQFGKQENGQLQNSRAQLYFHKGSEAGKIYELVYPAKDPPVVGLGLAAIRDIISFAKYDSTCVFPVRWGMAAGVSQTGRFLRHFLYQNFNQDESGKKAYDGMMIITAGAGRGSFNHRFAQPSRDGHRYSAFFYPTDLFPFTSSSQSDPELWREDGLLAHTDPTFWPNIFYVNTGYEYWGRAAALIHTDVMGEQDIAPYPNERIYHLSSGQHFVGAFPPSSALPYDSVGSVAFRGNPLDFSGNYRALIMRLASWVQGSRRPPSSRYPTLADRTLVAVEELNLPNIPEFEAFPVAHEAYRADYGPRWQAGIIDIQPPNLGNAYPSRVPQIDRYGNEIDGVRNVELRVPLATYFSWHVRNQMAGGNGELTDFRGTFIPLSNNNKQKKATGDSRPSISALYRNKNQYMVRVEGAMAELKAEGFLLDRDKDHIRRRAEAYWDWIMNGSVQE
ncbi:MAG: alpha/beta hydrolase domain-containing protein [Bacteroidota bacterium]